MRSSTQPPDLRFTKQPSNDHVVESDDVIELFCAGKSDGDVTIEWHVKPLLLDPGEGVRGTVERDYKLFDGWEGSEFARVEEFREFLNGSLKVAVATDGEKVTVKHNDDVSFAVRCSVGREGHVIESEEFRFTEQGC